ncbi:MAG: hypothetical protein QF570_01900 [Myxococcota bacterium]|jgi:hypothetical protein|nr:hypothetical protein [Myxococcota bacterium]
MKILKVAAVLVAVLVLTVGTAFVAARFNDGPVGMLPGGPLRSGPIVPYFIIAWSFARNVETIEMQLADDDTSRTTWFIEHEGRGFIPASVSFPPGKNWYLRADGSKAWLRIEGKRHEVRLDRFEDTAVIAELGKKVERKYGRAPGGSGGAWWFEVESIAPMPTVDF